MAPLCFSSKTILPEHSITGGGLLYTLWTTVEQPLDLLPGLVYFNLKLRDILKFQCRKL